MSLPQTTNSFNYLVTSFTQCYNLHLLNISNFINEENIVFILSLSYISFYVSQ